MKTLLCIYLFFILLGLPCYIYIVYNLFKEMIEDIVNSIRSDEDLSIAIAKTIPVVFDYITLTSLWIPIVTFILFIPIANVHMFVSLGCEIKNPFYKR